MPWVDELSQGGFDEVGWSVGDEVWNSPFALIIALPARGRNRVSLVLAHPFNNRESLVHPFALF